MRIRRLISIVLYAGVAAAPLAAAAQDPPPVVGRQEWNLAPEYRAIQQRALETQRRLLLAMADSMPEASYTESVTPPQRTFAQQVHHIVNASILIAPWYAGSTLPRPQIQDSTAVFTTRAGLKGYVNEGYDYLVRVLNAQDEGPRLDIVSLFGTEVPRWAIWDELNQHAMWTAGQIVANFRKHGMPPPAFLFF